jgi:hypothetical protein
MALTDLLVRPVTILAPTTTVNSYGDTQLSWTSPATVDTTGWLAQQSALENLDGRDAVITGLVVVLPAGTPITAVCRVVVDGRTYEVDGDPLSAWTPAGEHHIEAKLRAVAG